MIAWDRLGKRHEAFATIAELLGRDLDGLAELAGAEVLLHRLVNGAAEDDPVMDEQRHAQAMQVAVLRLLRRK